MKTSIAIDSVEGRMIEGVHVTSNQIVLKLDHGDFVVLRADGDESTADIEDIPVEIIYLDRDVVVRLGIASGAEYDSAMRDHEEECNRRRVESERKRYMELKAKYG